MSLEDKYERMHIYFMKKSKRNNGNFKFETRITVNLLLIDASRGIDYKYIHQTP